jgi:hypothetical protein
MANKCMKRYSTFLTIKEIQITMTLRFHLSPVRMVIIKKTNKQKNPTSGKDAGKRELLYTGGRNISSATIEVVWRFLKKLKLELSYNPAILLMDTYLKKCKSTYSQDICTPVFIAELFIIVKL